MLDEVRSLLILQDRDRRLLALAKELEKLPQDEARAKAKLGQLDAIELRMMAFDLIRKRYLRQWPPFRFAELTRQVELLQSPTISPARFRLR